MQAALGDIRVLDCSTSVAGAWCSRLLADFGADVLMIEPPGGHPLRHVGPDAPDGSSILARYVHANKRSVILDLEQEAGRVALADLAATCDIVVESPAGSPPVARDGRVLNPPRPTDGRDLNPPLPTGATGTHAGPAPGEGEWRGLDFDAIERCRPGCILVSITPNGLTGGRSGRAGNDLSAFALSGWASVNGLASREPLKGSGFIASYIAGIAAYGAAVTALYSRDRYGIGQQVDVAESETLLQIFGPALLSGQYRGRPIPRRPAADVIGCFPVPVRDGYLAIQFGQGWRLRDALLVLGLEDLAEDERFNKPAAMERNRREFSARVEAKMAGWSRMELFEALATMRINAGPVLRLDELAQNEHLRARGYYVRAEDDPTGPEYAGAPFQMSKTPWRLRRSLPELGADTAAVLELLHRDERSEPRQNPADPHPNPFPQGEGKDPRPVGRDYALCPTPYALQGIRALVLTHAWLGTFCTELLALAGAEVIQVEARRRPDAWRLGYETPMPPALRQLPSAQHAWNCSPLYNAVNLNKEGITLDLQTPEGIAIFRSLVPLVDVVAENFSPRVMQNLGIDYAALQKIRPDLIMCSLSAYGQTGPWRDMLGIGGTVEPSSGMSSLLGYVDGPPFNSGQMLPDPVGGYYGFAAIVTALRHRDQTGEGQFVDLSMQEANQTLIGDAMLDYMLTGNVRPRLGNRHLTFAPHGIYPADGDEHWIAIAAESEAQWQALCTAAGHREWLSDPRFCTNDARKQNEDALDAAIRAWTVTQPRDAADRLSVAGVIAAPVLNGQEVANDPVYRERGVTLEVTHPESGTWAQAGVPYHFSRTPDRVNGPAPVLGQDTAAVLQRLLALGPEAYAALVHKGISGSDPPD